MDIYHTHDLCKWIQLFARNDIMNRTQDWANWIKINFPQGFRSMWLQVLTKSFKR